MHDYSELDETTVKTLITGMNRILSTRVAFFAKRLEDYPPQKYVYVALETPETFKVYFTKCGAYHDADFIIAKPDVSIERIYMDLYKDISFDIFTHNLYLIGPDGKIFDESFGETLDEIHGKRAS